MRFRVFFWGWRFLNWGVYNHDLLPIYPSIYPAKHALKISTATVGTGGRKTTIQQDTHETRTKHQRELETTIGKHSPPPNEHESSVKGLTARTFHRDGRPDDDDGRRTTTDDPQIRAPSPSHWRIVSRSQLRSLARTHATQTQAQSKSISRFGGRTKACTTPPTSNYM